ncbi:hypothetical protein BMR1_02g04285, partial [Babesia microti strain RI]
MDGNIIIKQREGAISAHPFAQLAFSVASSANNVILEENEILKKNILEDNKDNSQSDGEIASEQEKTSTLSFPSSPSS